MGHTWEDFEKSGSIADYLAFCQNRAGEHEREAGGGLGYSGTAIAEERAKNSNPAEGAGKM